MTAPMNPGRYGSCFNNPWDRPSSLAFNRYVDAQTYETVQEAASWIDGLKVVEGAEAFLAREGRRFEARGESRGEPGA